MMRTFLKRESVKRAAGVGSVGMVEMGKWGMGNGDKAGQAG